MTATPTPDAAADAMRAVLTDNEQVLFEAIESYLLSASAISGNTNHLRTNLKRTCEMVRLFAARLHAAEQRQRWIPVTEATPPGGVTVLLCCRHGRVTEAYWHNSAPNAHATHWMPMPAPPLTPQTTAEAPATNEREPRT